VVKKYLTRLGGAPTPYLPPYSRNPNPIRRQVGMECAKVVRDTDQKISDIRVKPENETYLVL
jgi:hypothetical protein